MSRDNKPDKLKSVRTGKGMRSRGFLSHHRVRSDDSTASDTSKPDKSRGRRQAQVTGDGKPTDLTPRPAVRPYRLEDE